MEFKIQVVLGAWLAQLGEHGTLGSSPVLDAEIT